MKPFMTASLIAVLALPLAAQTADSPLVAAAKANSARVAALKKQAAVITNDDLIRAGGHIATTTNNASLDVKNLPKATPPNDYARNPTAPQVPPPALPAPVYSPVAATQLGQATAKAPESHMGAQQLQPAQTQQLQTTTAKPPVSNMTPSAPPVH